MKSAKKRKPKLADNRQRGDVVRQSEKSKWHAQGLPLLDAKANSYQENIRLEGGGGGKRRLAFLLILICIVIFHAIYTLGLFMQVGLNSDDANMVLEASDFLSGNIFMSGWNFTGLTFLTTDLMFYVISVLFVGVSAIASPLAIAIMFLFAFYSSTLLFPRRPKTNFVDWSICFILLMAVAGIPGSSTVASLRAHTAVAMYMFLMLFFSERLANKNKWIALGYVACVALAVMGDALALMLCALPTFAIAIYELVPVDAKNKKTNIKIIILTVTGVILGALGEKAFFVIGGAEKGTFLTGNRFVPLKTLYDQFVIYFDTLFYANSSLVWGSKIFSFSTFVACFRSAVLFFGLGLVAYNIVMFLRRKEYDKISTHISIGFLVVSSLYIFTTIGSGLATSRYFGWLNIAIAILIIRFIFKKSVENVCFFTKIITIKALAVVTSIFLIATSMRGVSFEPVYSGSNRQLIDILQKNDLENGYSEFWTASVNTVLSEENVKIRAITYHENHSTLGKFNWFCKDEWYEIDHANFIVVPINSDNANITKERVVEYLGNPDKVLSTDEHEVLAYEQSIADKIMR